MAPLYSFAMLQLKPCLLLAVAAVYRGLFSAVTMHVQQMWTGSASRIQRVKTKHSKELETAELWAPQRGSCNRCGKNRIVGDDDDDDDDDDDGSGGGGGGGDDDDDGDDDDGDGGDDDGGSVVVVVMMMVVMMMVMVVVVVVVMMTTTKPLSRLLSTIPDRQSKRLLRLATRLFQTPLRHEQRSDQ